MVFREGENTYIDILKYGKEQLIAENMADGDTDAFILFEYVFGMNRTEYILNSRKKCSDRELIKKYIEVIDKRKKHIPVQHITGVQEFMGYEFKVDEHTLIPRQDTEVLVENVIKALKDKKNPVIMDMCTGSGCIAISLGLLIKGSRIMAIDISEEALKVAREHAHKHQTANVSFLKSNIFNDIENRQSEKNKYDCIVSNPPYIKTDDIEGLMDEVKLHEPVRALDGYDDGLYFYREITKQAAGYLKDRGLLAYEIGYDQGKEVSDIMRENGFTDIAIIKDLAGLDRVVTGWLNH